LEEPKSELDLSDENLAYFEDHWDEIQEKYGGMTVAVSNKKVVAASDINDDFVSAVMKLSPKDRKGMYWRPVPRKDELVIV
jgi:hypothetical protein